MEPWLPGSRLAAPLRPVHLPTAFCSADEERNPGSVRQSVDFHIEPVSAFRHCVEMPELNTFKKREIYVSSIGFIQSMVGQ